MYITASSYNRKCQQMERECMGKCRGSVLLGRQVLQIAKNSTLKCTGPSALFTKTDCATLTPSFYHK